jgi:small-conductance mechanosensitive channel
LKEFLEYRLIEFDGYHLSVSQLIIISILFVVFYAVVFLLKRVLKRIADRKGLSDGSFLSIYQIVKYLIWITFFFVSLSVLNINISVILAGSAALLVGLGLGIQQLFNDYASGIVMLIERTVKIGDVIELEDGTVGKVLSIGIRTSTIETRDNIAIIIPNSKFVDNSVINWSHIKAKTRFNVSIGVAYGTDVKLVRSILLDIAENNKSIVKKPKPFVLFKDFGESSLDFSLVFWLNETWAAEKIKSDVRFQINTEFAKNNIQIPFPQRDIHMIKND